MTAEIVVMNREAVAMAADSAATAGSKIHQHASKLFTLSKTHPVGIMISNAASFMSVPWETVIKMYRQSTIKEAEKSGLGDYSVHFLASLNNPKLCPPDQQNAQVHRIACNHLEKACEAAKQRWLSNLVSTGKCSSRQKGIYIREVLTEYRDYLSSFADYPYSGLTPRKLVTLYRKDLERAIDDSLRVLSVTKVARSLAFECAKLTILKNIASDSHSTIAIAGFGSTEVFPSLEIVTIDGVVGGELKLHDFSRHEIDRNASMSLVRPLAQSEMVQRFMEGVDGTYQSKVDDYFRDFCVSIGMTITQADQVFDKFRTDMSKFREERFWAPITRTIVNLAKPDMARMAESLVSLTSLKRRVSEELETVADPIDVAVISKGDGFVWIKRKHYFSPELNPHYVTQYLSKR